MENEEDPRSGGKGAVESQDQDNRTASSLHAIRITGKPLPWRPPYVPHRTIIRELKDKVILCYASLLLRVSGNSRMLTGTYNLYKALTNQWYIKSSNPCNTQVIIILFWSMRYCYTPNNIFANLKPSSNVWQESQ